MTKGEYDTRLQSLSKLYEGIEGADIEAELTADLVGDYLFTDSDFVNSLSREHRNVFQKLYDEIKYLCKIATAGSKEARQLEKVKRAFDKAYKESETVRSPVLISLYFTDFATATIKIVKSGWRAIRENSRSSVRVWDTAAWQ